MNKQIPNFEWHIVENETEWACLCAASTVDVTPLQGGLAWQRLLYSVMATLLVLISMRIWWHYRDQVEWQAIQTDLVATAQPASQAPTHSQGAGVGSLTEEQAATRAENHLLASVAADESGAHIDIRLQTVDVQYTRAVATVVINRKLGEPAYRQTRFYRRSAAGWVRTPPDPALWGRAHHLETTFFSFHYRQQDAQVIAQVAPQLDALYTTLRRNLGLAAVPVVQKLPIEVSVTRPPGNVVDLWQPQAIHVPSPALYLAPERLTEAEILLQSLALPLLNHLLEQATEQHAIGEVWQPMLHGLRLWHLWGADLPLAVWRQDVVQWTYRDAPAVSLLSSRPLPDWYAEFCAAHTLWLVTPLQIQVPLECQSVAGKDWYVEWRRLRHPPLRLADLGAPDRPDQYIDVLHANERTPHPGRAVAQATLLEYITAVYGQERLPDLLASFGQHESWETLLPALFGVSAAEFEAGWQAHLAKHYGVATVTGG